MDQPHSALDPPVPALRRWLRRAMWAAAAFPFVVLAFVGLFLAWLTVAPVPLTPFAGTVEAAINRALDGRALVRVGDLALSWFPGSNRVGFQLIDVSVRDPGGALLTYVPEANVGFALGAVLDGKLAPRRIELRRLSADVVRDAEGQVQLGVARLDGPDGETDPRAIAAVLDTLLAPPDTGDVGTYLAIVSIAEARITVDDRVSGLYLVAPQADLVLRRGEDGVEAELNAGLETGGRIWPLVVRARYARGSDNIQVEIGFPDITLAELSTQGSLFQPLRGFAVPARGTLGLTFNRTGALHSMSAWLSVGAGSVQLEGAQTAFAMRSADLRMEYDAGSRSLLLERLDLRAEWLSGLFTGRARFDGGVSGAPSGLEAQVTGDMVRINWPGLFAGPAAFDRILVRGAGDWVAGTLALDQVELRRGDMTIALAATVTAADPTPAVQLTGQFSGIAIPDLPGIWPLHVAPGARAWIASNMPAGRIPKAVLKVDIPAGAMAEGRLAEEMVRLDFAFEETEASYLRGLTPVTGARGSATLTGDSFTADVDEAQVGPLRIRRARVSMTELHKVGAPGAIEARASGRIADVLRLIDMQPLGYTTRFGLDADAVSGTAEIDVQVRLPLLRNVTFEQVDFAIKARTEGVGLAMPDGTTVADGRLQFEVNGSRLVASGPVTVSGQALDVRWVERFEGDGDTTALEAAAVLDDARRRDLGIALDGYVAGPVKAVAAFRGRGMALRRGEIRLDLTDAVLDLSEAGYYKPAGTPAEAIFEARFSRGGELAGIDKLRATGEGLHVAGSIGFDAQGRLSAVNLPRLKLATATDVALTATREKEAFSVTVVGDSLDLGGLLESYEPGGSSEEGGTDLAVSLAVDRLLLREGATIRGARADLVFKAGDLFGLDLSGSSGTGAVSLTIATDATGIQRIRATSSDAGELLKGLTGFRSMRGGKLVFAAERRITGDHATTGRLRVNDFRIVDQPFLARLFAAGSLTGIADLLGGEGITFTLLDIPFAWRDRRWELEGARASGPSIGLTAEGHLGGPEGRVHVAGTLVPIYGINNLLDGIPIIGDILTSREGEGILGMTYAVRGTDEELAITVNPLSAIAPGIFRRIFEFSDSPQAQEGVP